MTAEVAILNKSAVALAADSAVTISLSSSKRKTYVANKLFTLSKYHPVGVMIFGNAEILGVPWETILKQYRAVLGRESFSTISEYTENLLAYLGKITPYFPEEQQRAFFYSAVYSYFHNVLEKLHREHARTPGEPASEANVRYLANNCDLVLSRPLLACVDEEFAEKLRTEYGDQITAAFNAVFEHEEIPGDIAAKLKQSAAHYMVAYPRPSWRSGLVIAGFGESQIFPAIRTVSCNLIAMNRVIYLDEKHETEEINFGNEAALIPFAQRDVVTTFVEGIKPSYRDLLDSAISTVFDGLPSLVLEKLADIEESTRLEIAQTIENNAFAAKEEFFRRLTREIQAGEIRPLLDIIEAMPKDELAQMAEALVNLTSVKRKMSHDLETVGGPIDVAVISKGDGFIWMSRKHYFKPELNVHFSSTYFER